MQDKYENNLRYIGDKMRLMLIDMIQIDMH